MSKIGRIPIQVPNDAKLEIAPGNFKVSGPKGELSLDMSGRILVEQIDANKLEIKRLSEDKETKALHGLWRVLIDNAIKGVTVGWEKKMDFKGVGFRAEVQGDKLVMNLGFSHPVEVLAPEGITFNVTKNVITVSGIDKQIVGQVAANIRQLKPVEPYKGKGIKYIDEIPRRKLGKQAKAAAK
jgi:large subunit ribosomal protein L6